MPRKKKSVNRRSEHALLGQDVASDVPHEHGETCGCENLEPLLEVLCCGTAMAYSQTSLQKMHKRIANRCVERSHQQLGCGMRTSDSASFLVSYKLLARTALELDATSEGALKELQ